MLAAIIAADFPTAQAQNEDEATGRIVARRLDDGRVEFGWQPTGGVRVLPRQRYFPADITHNRWLRSSPVEVDGAEIGRINARLLSNGRIEFAFTPTDGERITPQARYFPTNAHVGRWLRSTEITISPPATGYIAISAGGSHTCGLRTSGELACWGDNEYGQTNAPEGSYTAVGVAVNSPISCGLRETGAIECWGDTAAFEDDLPTGSYIAISAGFFHVCGLRENGELDCTHGRDTPAGPFIAVSIGGTTASHACAIRESGELACWGANEQRQYQWNEETQTVESRSVHVGQATPPPGTFTAVSAGSSHTCAIRTSGQLACWGANDHEQSNAPEGSYTAVSAGNSHSCAIRDTGEIECWGGDNLNWQRNAPEGSYIAVSAAGSHTCAIRESGDLACWGSNRQGQATPPPN